jgi:CubicO group peptidase (beta-lactamase class C family)
VNTREAGNQRTALHYAAGYGVVNGLDLDVYDLEQVYGYAYKLGVQEVETFPDSAWVRPAGGVWSTASDMAALAGFFLDGDPTVLPDALREGLVTGQAPFYPKFDFIQYGQGVMVYDAFSWSDGWHETPLWLHGGNHFAYTSSWTVLPEARIAQYIRADRWTKGAHPCAPTSARDRYFDDVQGGLTGYSGYSQGYSGYSQG